MQLKFSDYIGYDIYLRMPLFSAFFFNLFFCLGNYGEFATWNEEVSGTNAQLDVTESLLIKFKFSFYALAQIFFKRKAKLKVVCEKLKWILVYFSDLYIVTLLDFTLFSSKSNTLLPYLLEWRVLSLQSKAAAVGGSSGGSSCWCAGVGWGVQPQEQSMHWF